MDEDLDKTTQPKTEQQPTVETNGEKDTTDKIVEETGPALDKAKEILALIHKHIDNPDLNLYLDDDKKAEIVAQIQELEIEEHQLETLVEVLVIASQELPADIEAQGRNLKTTYVPKNSTGDKATFKEKILPNMHKAMYTVLSALQENKFPFGIIGSNAFVLEAKGNTSKQQDDLDMNAAINDFPVSYKNLKKLETEGKIKKMRVVGLTDLKGKKDRSFEIKGFVPVGENEEIEFSIFYSNINPNEEDNGLTSFGYKENEINEYELKGEEGEPVLIAPAAGRGSTERMYSENALNEILLFAFEIYEKSKQEFPWVTPKVLQRLSNLAALNDYDFDVVIRKLESVKSRKNQEHFDEAIAFIKNLRTDYKGNEFAGKGLSEDICNGIGITKNCEEKAVDIITKEVKAEMEEVFKIVDNCKNTYESPDLTPENKIGIINAEWEKIAKMYDKYFAHLKNINNKDDRDFVPFVAMQALERDFLSPAINRLWVYMDDLKNDQKGNL